MAKKPGPDDAREAVEKVKALGYRVVKQGVYHRTTVSVHEDTLNLFKQLVDELGYRMQDAVTEALDDWCKEKQVELARRKADKNS